MWPQMELARRSHRQPRCADHRLHARRKTCGGRRPVRRLFLQGLEPDRSHRSVGARLIGTTGSPATATAITATVTKSYGLPRAEGPRPSNDEERSTSLLRTGE